MHKKISKKRKKKREKVAEKQKKKGNNNFDRSLWRVCKYYRSNELKRGFVFAKPEIAMRRGILCIAKFFYIHIDKTLGAKLHNKIMKRLLFLVDEKVVGSNLHPNYWYLLRYPRGGG